MKLQTDVLLISNGRNKSARRHLIQNNKPNHSKGKKARYRELNGRRKKNLDKQIERLENTVGTLSATVEKVKRACCILDIFFLKIERLVLTGEKM